MKLKRHLIIAMLIFLGAFSLRAQDDTTRIRSLVCPCTGLYPCNCGCQHHPVNNYPGLNSLRARLANPSWNGRDSITNPFAMPSIGKDALETTTQNISSHAVLDSTTANLSVEEFSGPDASNRKYLQDIEKGETPLGPPVSVFFRIASCTPTDMSQLVNVGILADMAVSNGLTIRVTGSADSATGSLDRNAKLADERVKYLVKYLVERGVDEEAIETRSVGGVDLYTPVQANRNCVLEVFMKR